MPELPEVENIKLQLERFLVGYVIEKIEIRTKKYEIPDKKKIAGGKVVRVRRFGKALVIDLSNGYSIVIHVKLTGQLIYRGPNLPSKGGSLSAKVLGGLGGKHTHVIFELDHDGKLYYNDVRKFGWIKLVRSDKLKAKSKFIGKLGPEPVIDEKNPPENPLTLGKFKEIVASTSRAIKTLLMDQTKIAGVGNIYANDALWLSKINPCRRAGSLKEKEVESLLDAIVEVLRRGLKSGGASELAYVRPDGTEGKYQDYTLVYGKEGENCPNNCGAKIKRIKVSGRGTYFCPRCQG